MERQIIRTADGSTTIRIADWDECYHSKHGAIQEARHVFIKSGLALFDEKPVSILEIGFGTGLNALMTWHHRGDLATEYIGVEAFPVTAEEAGAMNYAAALDRDADGVFRRMHRSEWEIPQNITSVFTLTKRNIRFEEIGFASAFDLIYFDAFGYHVQPELWSEDIFLRMYRSLRPGGVLVTYAARTAIKKNMQAAGFVVEKLPGPPGKREMMRARKP
jgi:tRNA U34 5-methylaminomethyl-2-thiouridine-forming methyltransferase MnmC